MWSEGRAAAARRDLEALASGGLAVEEVLAVAIDVVGRVVPFDATCWATVDPETMMLTGSTTVAFEPSPELEQHFVELEYGGEEVNSFASLAGSSSAVARLSDAPYGEVVRSRRVHEIYRPLGVAHELRLACRIDGSCWAVAGMLRSATSPDFSDRELSFLQLAAPAIARATKEAVRHVDGAGGADGDAAVIVLGSDGTVRSSTPAAASWVATLHRAGGVGVALRAVAALASGSSSSAGRVARLRDADGRWVVLRASPLLGDAAPGDVVVTVEPAAPQELTRLLLCAHGLSPREQEVTMEVLAGRSTAEVAERLFIAQSTVQDHLKVVFAKVGVRSRRELVARLR